jgi:hypothetical protein
MKQKNQRTRTLFMVAVIPVIAIMRTWSNDDDY